MSDDFRIAPSGYPPRYGPGSQDYTAPALRGPGCTHQAPDSCLDCDGSNPWTSARIPEAIPPCMRKPSDTKGVA